MSGIPREAYQLEKEKWNVPKGIFEKNKKIPSEVLIGGAASRELWAHRFSFVGRLCPEQ